MFEVHFQRDWSRLGLTVYAFIRQPGHTRIPLKITIEKGEPISGAEAQPPSLVDVEDEFIKAVIDGLQRADLMPQMGATEAELKATKFHLEDFRKLVFERAFQVGDKNG